MCKLMQQFIFLFQISSVQKKNEDLGQEEIVQLCMKNVKWVEDLFEKFGELLNHVQQKCP